MPESKINTAASRKEKFEEFDRSMQEAQDRLTDEEREFLDRALKRSTNKKTIMTNNKILQFTLVALPVVIIIVAVLGMMQTITRREQQRTEADIANIQTMAKAWYGSWDEQSGSVVYSANNNLDSTLALNSEAFNLYRHTSGGEASLFMLPNPTCLVDSSVEHIKDRDYKLTVTYAEVGGANTPKSLSDIEALDTQTAEYLLTLDSASRITKISLVEE